MGQAGAPAQARAADRQQAGVGPVVAGQALAEVERFRALPPRAGAPARRGGRARGPRACEPNAIGDCFARCPHSLHALASLPGSVFVAPILALEFMNRLAAGGAGGPGARGIPRFAAPVRRTRGRRSSARFFGDRGQIRSATAARRRSGASRGRESGAPRHAVTLRRKTRGGGSGAGGGCAGRGAQEAQRSKGAKLPAPRRPYSGRDARPRASVHERARARATERRPEARW